MKCETKEKWNTLKTWEVSYLSQAYTFLKAGQIKITVYLFKCTTEQTELARQMENGLSSDLVK